MMWIINMFSRNVVNPDTIPNLRELTHAWIEYILHHEVSWNDWGIELNNERNSASALACTAALFGQDATSK